MTAAAAAVLVAAAALAYRPAPPSRRLRAEADALRQADVMIIDGDNVRGKTSFQWSPAELADLTAAWAHETALDGRVLLLFDHGTVPDAAWRPDGLAVAFSGPRAKADDVIVDAVRWLTCEVRAVVTVATADTELGVRCAKGALARRHLHLVSPGALIAALRHTADGVASAAAATPEAEAAPTDDAPTSGSRGRDSFGSRERRISSELLELGHQLRRGCGRKKRLKLTRRRQQLERARWALLAAEVSAASEPGAARAGERAVADAAPQPAGSPHATTRTREPTAVRMLTAEQYRLALRSACAPDDLPVPAQPTPPACASPLLATYLKHRAGAPPGARTPATGRLSGGTAAEQHPSGRALLSAERAARFELRAQHSLLLAVDVGARVGGFALFDARSGRLLEYGPLSGSTGAAGATPSSAEAELATMLGACARTGGVLERAVLEGNAQLTARWRDALLRALADGDARREAEDGSDRASPRTVDAVCVSAETWRAALLTAREQRDKGAAKAAARLIARQVMQRSRAAGPGAQPRPRAANAPRNHGGAAPEAHGTRRARLDTNVAEAICAGHWAAHALWGVETAAAHAAAGGAGQPEASGAGSGSPPGPPLVERTLAGEIDVRALAR